MVAGKEIPAMVPSLVATLGCPIEILEPRQLLRQLLGALFLRLQLAVIILRATLLYALRGLPLQHLPLLFIPRQAIIATASTLLHHLISDLKNYPPLPPIIQSLPIGRTWTLRHPYVIPGINLGLMLLLVHSVYLLKMSYLADPIFVLVV